MLRRYAWCYVLTLVSLITLAGCGGATDASPPAGLAVTNVMSDVATVLDRRTNGPNAWIYKVDVGKNAGQNRLMMYYIQDNYCPLHDCHIPPLGTSNDTQFLAKMNQYSDQYNKADPEHPVVGAIDLLNPVPDPSPQSDGSYHHYRNPDQIDDFLKLARDNKMLFFFDVAVGHSTPQKEFETLRPYLEQPDINLAYDPEWDMRPGVVPGEDRGRTTAQNINWLIDQLSSLVTTKHLPDKFLVIHIFFADEQYDNPYKPDPTQSWANIQPKPGVKVIISYDGQGANQLKKDNYENLIAGSGTKNSLNLGAKNLTGLKIYTQVPCDGNHSNCEIPMTPQQALALKPTPMMIMYG